MIIILGRKDATPRVITGVTQVRRIGTQNGEYMGWWRKGRTYGNGYSMKWLASRFTHVIVVDERKMRMVYEPTFTPTIHPEVRRVSDVLH